MTVFLILAWFSFLGVVLYASAILIFRSPRWCEPGQAPPPDHAPFLPPVSILKPLKGVDGHLQRNLESFCELDYPDYEIIFAVHGPEDPALAVVESIRRAHPERTITVLTELGPGALNQKVASLIPAMASARHAFVLISDGNVMAEPDYLRETICHMSDPRVGLVSNLIRGMGGRSLGARMENMHLNSFIMASIAFLDRHLALPLSVGKSMLIRREALESIGGIGWFRDILAEDYIIGRNLHRAGWKVALCHHKVNNVNEGWDFRSFVSRHARWGRLRWKVGRMNYFWEPLGFPAFLAALALPFAPLSLSLPFFLAVAAAVSLGNLIMGKLVESDLSPRHYLLSPIKDLVVGAIWFVPFFSSTVTWRGVKYRIGKDSRLTPLVK